MPSSRRLLAKPSVENGRVLALHQAHAADLAGDGDVHVRAHDLAADLGGAQLMVIAHGREHTGDGHGLYAAHERGEKRPGGLLVQRGELLAVVLEAAADDRALFADEADVVGPVRHGGHAQRRGRADAKQADAGEVLALDDGVGALGGAQHGLADLAAVHLRLLQQLPHRAHDAVKDVGGGGIFDFGDNVEVAVDEDGVGVGAAHVDTQLIHARFLPSRAPPRGCSRRRCQSSAGRPARCPRVCATWDSI